MYLGAVVVDVAEAVLEIPGSSVVAVEYLDAEVVEFLVDYDLHTLKNNPDSLRLIEIMIYITLLYVHKISWPFKRRKHNTN